MRSRTVFLNSQWAVPSNKASSRVVPCGGFNVILNHPLGAKTVFNLGWYPEDLDGWWWALRSVALLYYGFYQQMYYWTEFIIISVRHIYVYTKETPVIAYTMATEAPSPIQNRQKNTVTESKNLKLKRHINPSHYSLFGAERSTTSMTFQS